LAIVKMIHGTEVSLLVRGDLARPSR
jgi:hypothetical protein